MNRLVIGFALAASLAAFAQEKKEIRTFQIKVDAPAGAAAGGDHVFVAAGAGPAMQIERFSASPVKGAPYSAEATTETVQTLADGNRIVNKNTSRMFRDAEGRTRIDNNFLPSGFWVPAAGKELSFTMIMDPVAGVHYSLNNSEKTATKMPVPHHQGPVKVSSQSEAGKHMRIEHDVVVHHAGPNPNPHPMPAAGAGPAVMVFDRREGFPLHAAPGDMKKEDLGKQTIEGVLCEGTRETFVVPAGQIGNEREIKTVTELWYSPELGFDVLRKHSDPRGGETTYRVSRIARADQPRSLFEVPSDYKLEEIKHGPDSIAIERKIKEKK